MFKSLISLERGLDSKSFFLFKDILGKKWNVKINAMLKYMATSLNTNIVSGKKKDNGKTSQYSSDQKRKNNKKANSKHEIPAFDLGILSHTFYIYLN